MEASSGAKEENFNRIANDQIRNAELLLTYASETGISLQRETIENIIRLKHAVNSGLTPDDPVELETNFLQATEALAKAVSPVTVASLHASYDKQDDTSLIGRFRKLMGSPRQVSLASLSVRRFRYWALVTLVLLLVLQTYWVIGSSVSDDVTATLKQVETNKTQMEFLKKEAKVIEENLKESARKEIPEAGNRRTNDTQLGTELNNKLNEISVITARLNNYEQETELNYQILNHWNEYWRRPIQFFGDILAKNTQRTSENEKDVDPYERLLISQKTAQFVIYALQIYLLPILYGLLGAITYVLRTLAVQIRNFTYTTESDICFRLRMNLGAFSGLSIVWFIKGGGDTQLPFASLSQFAVAFIAGYSVELLFTAMDRFITAFSGNNKDAG